MTVLAAFYAHGFLLDVVYTVVVAVVLYAVIALLLHRDDLARTVAGIVIALGLLIALVDNLS